MEVEGYVKYRCIHEDGMTPDHQDWDALNALRSDLFKTGLVGVLENGVGYGNISLRLADSSFLISATATGGIPVLKREHYSHVFRYDLENNTVWSRGKRQASSEAMTHAAVYEASPVTQCVIHLHHRNFFEQLLRCGAPATAPDALFGTPQMAFSVRDLTARHPADGVIVMTGHQDGFLLYGPNVDHVRDLLSMLTMGYIPV